MDPIGGDEEDDDLNADTFGDVELGVPPLRSRKKSVANGFCSSRQQMSSSLPTLVENFLSHAKVSLSKLTALARPRRAPVACIPPALS